jgi:hypothetical protein
MLTKVVHALSTHPVIGRRVQQDAVRRHHVFEADGAFRLAAFVGISTRQLRVEACLLLQQALLQMPPCMLGVVVLLDGALAPLRAAVPAAARRPSPLVARELRRQLQRAARAARTPLPARLFGARERASGLGTPKRRHPLGEPRAHATALQLGQRGCHAVKALGGAPHESARRTTRERVTHTETLLRALARRKYFSRSHRRSMRVDDVEDNRECCFKGGHAHYCCSKRAVGCLLWNWSACAHVGSYCSSPSLWCTRSCKGLNCHF